MYLIPAIDLLHGRTVRLVHGNFENVTDYDLDPLELAESYHEAGAEWLHVVDLAASRDGEAGDPEALFKLLGVTPQKVQIGGGVRDRDDVMGRLNNGAERVVVGSVCLTQPELFVRWLDDFGADRLVAALDVHLDRDGVAWPRAFGWTETAEIDLDRALAPLLEGGLRHLLVTDIGRDGALSGPNLELYRDLAMRYPGLEIQASGGVAGLRDLADLRETGVAAVISGKALLSGCFTAAEAVRLLQQPAA